MADTYASFQALAAAERVDAYSILVRNTGSSLVIAAPHGGGIEPGTSEIALAIAGDDLSCYLFEGKKPDGNHDLHLTSARFDEPQGLALLRSGQWALTVHGEDSPSEVVYLGGAQTSAHAAVRAMLAQHGFVVREHANPQLQGALSRNICNLGRLGAGLQLELSQGLRETFFQSLSRAGRQHPTARLTQFSAAIRQALSRIEAK